MITHPEARLKAQAEIDAVVGTDRLPSFADRPSLPYVECVMSECLRWAAPVPLGQSFPSLTAQGKVLMFSM